MGMWCNVGLDHLIGVMIVFSLLHIGLAFYFYLQACKYVKLG